MWLTDEIEKYKNDPLFKIACSFIDLGEEIAQYMKGEHRTPRDIKDVLKQLEEMEARVLE